jgi:hypothetical protein
MASKMSNRVKELSLDELEERARVLTSEALEDYVIPDDMRTNLVLGTFFEEGTRIFELYVPGDRPSDALVITRARMDTETGEGVVEVFELERKPSE